ncbi:MAG: YbgC/FadM family acyl-CoA thioesterase [Chitinispirillales bacterium]|jgi:tol-pal system-associated acyl-CoA thioesterase|nr:YbgC/FadM family acyl-CoA thioesterase [Chitinispirillales bacterium]
MSKTNEISVRIYYEDTDCGDVVYYANYLRYMERGRTELLRDMGIDLFDYHKKGLLFAVVEANVKYKQSARYNDLLTIVTSLKEKSAATMIFHTEIRRGDTVLAYGDVKVACVKVANGVPGRIPAEIIEALL